MLPATIFRRIQLQQTSNLSKSIAQLVLNSNISAGCITNAINCLNRHAAATGFIRTSFLDINQCYNFDVASKLCLYADAKKTSIQLHTLKGRDILQEVINKKKDRLIEKKNVIFHDIREVKCKVKERVRVKIEEVKERENILTIPNFLTTGRVFLSPYVGYVIIEGNHSVALILLAVAGITDLLDGQIARRWPNQASKFGSFLDPLADKLLIGCLVVSLGYCELLPLWLSSVILFRDAFLIAAGFVIRYISLPPPKTFTRYFDATYVTAQLEPTLISKVNTAVQLTTIGVSLAAPIWNYMDHAALHGLWYLTGATTLAAAISYIANKNTFKIIKKPHRVK